MVAIGLILFFGSKIIIKNNNRKSDPYNERSEDFVHDVVLLIVMAVILIGLFVLKQDYYLDDYDYFFPFFTTYINMYYFYNLFIIILFPVVLIRTLMKLIRTSFHMPLVITSCIKIIFISLFGFLFYGAEPSSSLLLMAFFNTLTVIFALRTYCWKNTKSKIASVIVMILYALFWMIMFRYSYDHVEFLSSFFYGNDVRKDILWKAKKIMSGSAVIGPDQSMTSDKILVDFIGTQYNPIWNAAFYGGKIAVAAVVEVQTAFFISSFFVMFNNRLEKGYDFIFLLAWCSLALHYIMGNMYAFDIIPYGLELPFSATVRSINDSVAFGLLVLEFLSKNRKKIIRRYASTVRFNHSQVPS